MLLGQAMQNAWTRIMWTGSGVEEFLLGKQPPPSWRFRESLISGGQTPNHKSLHGDEKLNFGALFLINFLFQEMQSRPFKIKLIF